MKQRKRNEIDDKYKWDLSLIYNNCDDWYNDFDKCLKEVNKVCEYKGKLTSSASCLLEYITYSLDYERRLYKLYFYAHLKHDEDTTNTKAQEMSGKILDLINKFEENEAFANPELMSVDYKVLEKFMEEEPKLKEYDFLLENIYRYKKHILNDDSEKLLSSLSNVFSSSEKTYESLTDSDMKFGFIDTDEGSVELTSSNYSLFIKDENRDVRKQAFMLYHNTYGNLKNTLASIYKSQVDTLTTIAKIRKYNSSLEASLFADNIPTLVYDNLIKTVNDNMSTIYRYFDLKKRVLGLDELHLYDVYVELIKDLDKDYSFEDAKELVIDALSVLGEDYIKIINKAFDEKWIDVYNNVGKRSGAYSSGFYDTNPYVLLNYEGKLKDVSTLAHELGHSAHTYLSCKNNPYHYSSYKIFVAEVASTVNELLLNKYLLKNSKSKEEKLFVLNNMMELFKGTIYRQVMFAEFEKITHAKKENGEILTYELLNNIYYDLNKKYFGDGVYVDDEIKYEWSRIPHFYYDFYVYKYAIGLSSDCYIVEGILNNKENALENYLKFLKTGGSMYPIDELKVAGVDVTKSEVVISAIKMFDEVMNQFEALID